MNEEQLESIYGVIGQEELDRTIAIEKNTRFTMGAIIVQCFILGIILGELIVRIAQW